VPRLIREHFTFFLGTALAGLALRLLFVVYFPAMTDDSRIYADLATNWLQHGIYGQTQGGQPEKTALPTDARLPGYPAFLAGVFWLFGAGNFRAVMLAQVLVDLATCFLLADLARRMVADRAARIAFILAALCPFLANYTAAILSETLEISFTALALDFAAAALSRTRDEETGALRLWAATGAAIGACILLRPDGGILLAAVVLYLVVFYPIAAAPKGVYPGTQSSLRDSNYSDRLYPALRRWARLVRPSGAGFSGVKKLEFREHLPDSRSRSLTSVLGAGIIVALIALAPLAPWTIRNFRTLHHFQPLAPRYANETDELVPRGFNRWIKTWIIDYASVEEIYWNVPGDKIDARKLPSRAIENPAEREATLALIADYNEPLDITPELDARFGELAADRIRTHPVRYYLALPFLRVTDMWLRPRTELLPPDPRWWEFNDERRHSFIAVGFGLMNLVYVGAALLALIRRPSGVRWAGLLVGFLLLRSAFLATLENPEPRYTLEGYPAVIVLAAACVGTGLRPVQAGHSPTSTR
jgi:hypothetical protein